MDLYPNMLLPERKEESPFWYLCLGPSYSIERRIEKHKTTFCRKEMMSLTSGTQGGRDAGLFESRSRTQDGRPVNAGVLGCWMKRSGR